MQAEADDPASALILRAVRPPDLNVEAGIAGCGFSSGKKPFMDACCGEAFEEMDPGGRVFCS